ncbi:MAG: alkaline phosphatase family protein [Isosphaeraceae bacterium]
MTGPRLASKVLLVGWDAADWKFINPLLDAGLMPNLARLVDGGVIANLASLRPCLSPILWTSIATGKTADKHGITGFVEPIPGGAGVRLSTSTSRTTKALWNILSQSGLNSVVVHWYASHPAEPIRGACVAGSLFEGRPASPDDPWPVPAGAVHPEALASALADCRLHPAELGPPDLAP